MIVERSFEYNQQNSPGKEIVEELEYLKRDMVGKDSIIS
jgi:hypothetical protein